MTTSDDSEALPWSVERVLEALEAPSIALKDKLRHEPSGDVLIESLRRARADKPRKILCDVLGDRHEKAAVAALVEQLETDAVRASAADALAKIRDPGAGFALASFFEREAVPSRRAMLAAALGAVGHRASAPPLTAALSDESDSVRGSAAWSLGEMLVSEALDALRAALAVETSTYPKQRMVEAIERIERIGSTSS